MLGAARTVQDKRALSEAVEHECGAHEREPCAPNLTACSGLKAARTCGSRTRWLTPRIEITTNHTSITGPKRAPTHPVPNLCTRKRMTSTMTVIGTTNGEKTGVMTSRPSIALRTE